MALGDIPETDDGITADLQHASEKKARRLWAHDNPGEPPVRLPADIEAMSPGPARVDAINQWQFERSNETRQKLQQTDQLVEQDRVRFEVIAFTEIAEAFADRHAKKHGTEQRPSALRQFWSTVIRAIEHGEFDGPRNIACRNGLDLPFTKATLASVRESSGPDDFISAYVYHLWCTPEVAFDWCGRYGFELPPRWKGHFDLAGRTTTAVEQEAISILIPAIRANPHMRREEAKALISKAGLSISGAGLRSRVWPSARERAGLSPKANAGRKPKSDNQIGDPI